MDYNDCLRLDCEEMGSNDFQNLEEYYNWYPYEKLFDEQWTDNEFNSIYNSYEDRENAKQALKDKLKKEYELEVAKEIENDRLRWESIKDKDLEFVEF